MYLMYGYMYLFICVFLWICEYDLIHIYSIPPNDLCTVSAYEYVYVFINVGVSVNMWRCMFVCVCVYTCTYTC